MKFGLSFIVLLFSVVISSAQTVGSELQLGIDYINAFSRSKSDDYKEVEEHDVNLGIKLQTTIYNRLDFGLSFDVLSILDDVRFLKRAHFYGVFVYYEFLPTDARFNFDLALTLRGAKFRSTNEHPFYEDANWSLYSGSRMHLSYQPIAQFPNVRLYTGMHISFPVFRHSFWQNISGNYANLNTAYLGVSYTIGRGTNL